MYNKIVKGLFFLFLGVAINSCSKELDFEQPELGIVFEPIIETNLVFFNVKVDDFPDVNSIAEGFVLRDTISEIEIFTGAFIQDNLVRSVFTYENQNTINRDFSIQLDYIDETDTIRHTTLLNVPRSTTNPIQTVEDFNGDILIDIKSTVTIIFTLKLAPNTNATNTLTTGEISLKSKSTNYLKINTAS